MCIYTDIHTYRVYIHTLTDMYTRICTYPDSACTHQKRKVTVFFFWWPNLSHSCSHAATIYGLQSHTCGAPIRTCQIEFQLSYNVLVTAYKVPPGYSAAVLQTKQGYFAGYYGSRIGSCVVSPHRDSTAGTLQGCGLNVQCCSITVYVQNFSHEW